MVSINLTGEKKPIDAPPKVKLEEDTYSGVISRISDILTVPDFSGGDSEKIVFDLTCDDAKDKDGNPAVLTFWCTAKVHKGNVDKTGRKFSDSKLYETLEKANLMEKLNDFGSVFESYETDEEKNRAFTKFLRDYLLDAKCRFIIKNRTSKEGEEYSTVDRFTKIEANVVTESAEEPAEAEEESIEEPDSVE